jgi:hypothetical protein
VKNYKTCPTCKQTKAIDEFVKNKSTKTGYASCCKKCHAAKAKAWREANPDEQKRRSRKQYAKSRDREIARRKKRYLENRELEIAMRRQNYAQNADKYRQQSKDWRKNNKDQFDAQWRKARAKRAAVRTEKYTTAQVLERWGTDCHLCGESIDLEAPRWTGSEGWRRGLHLDHVIRIKDGGEDSIDNVKPAHGECNIRKH